MISMSCKSQAEVFARSLQTKLKILNNNGSNNDSSDEDAATSDDGRAEWLQSRFRSTQPEHFVPAPGTTFPPGRYAHFDLLRSKYHSETDLTPANMALIRKTMDDDLQDLLKGGKNPHINDDEEKDSDLFFDFDIGSPEESEVVSEKNSTNERKNSLETANVLDLAAAYDNEQNSDMVLRACYSDNNSLDNSPETLGESKSRFFGSASSGLYSDLDTLQSRQEPNDDDDDLEIGDEDAGCMSIDPHDWALKLQEQQQQQKLVSGQDHSASSTPIATQSPINTSSPLVSPDSLLDETPSHQEVEAPPEAPDLEKIENEIDAGNFHVYTGSAVHKVANSKLNALIALLEPEREYNSRASSRSSSIRSSKESSPTKSVGRRGGHQKCALPTIAASPANFSFLADNLGKEALDASTEGEKKVEDEKSLIRCDSTPVLSTSEREFIDSPKLGRKEIVAAEKKEKKVEPAPEVKKDTLTVEKPERIRRATSLKSGKTPPGTPGRRKIVR